MKRTKRNKLFAVVIMLAVALPLMFASAVPVFAENDSSLAGLASFGMMYYPKIASDWNTENCKQLAPEGEYTVNWEKTMVWDPTIVELRERDGLYVVAKKAGTTTISLVATAAGCTEEQTYQFEFSARKYVNPLKTIKIGKTNYAKKFNKISAFAKKGKKLSGKLTVKVKKGWKIKKIQRVNMNQAYYTFKTIKNNRKVTLKGKIPQAVLVIAKNKKNGDEIYIMLECVSKESWFAAN